MPIHSFSPTICDAYISSSNPNKSYSINESKMKVGWETSGSYRGILLFDTSSIYSRPIMSATLILHVASYATFASPAFVRKLTITQNVDSEYVNWNRYQLGVNWTLPGGDFTTTNQASFNLPTSGSPLSINVTGIVQSSAYNPVRMILMRSTEGGSSSIVDFCASYTNCSACDPYYPCGLCDPYICGQNMGPILQVTTPM